MSQTAKASATPDVIRDAEPTLLEDKVSHPPVLITQQEVVFSTAAVMSPRSATISRRLIDWIRIVGAALRRPPTRRDYPQRSSYLELSSVTREMNRL